MLTGSRPRVLVVDNLADAADSLVLLLELWGFGAEACYDGLAAVGIARALQPQAVLLDIAMPGMDGFEVARRLREQPGSEQTVLVALTGYDSQAYRIRAREEGFQHYLRKPTEPEVLRELLTRAVARPASPWACRAGPGQEVSRGREGGTGPRAEVPPPADLPGELTCPLVRVSQ